MAEDIKRPVWPLSLKVYLGLAAFSIAGTAARFGAGVDPGPIAPIAGAMTILAACWAIWEAADRQWLPLLIAAIIGGVSEWIGLKTGAIFGRYEYVDWQPMAGGFPLLLPLAWAFFGVGSYIAVRQAMNSWWCVPVAGLVAAALDLVMEPILAGPLQYWRWLDGGPLPGNVPIQNFIGWFLVAAVAAIPIHLMLRDRGLTIWPARVALGAHLLMLWCIGLLTPGFLSG